ncbi:unnamed protein product [Rotaria socialis]
MIQPVQSTTQNTIPSSFLLSAYGIDNTATANDILQRWWYIFNQCLQRNIRIIGFATDADAQYVRAMRLMNGFFASLPKFPVHQHQQTFTVKLKSRWPWFFLREQQLLLFFQDATHLATKWRNRLLSSTAELRLGDQSISINHLYSIIDNAKFTKIDHGLTKSDINPKDRLRSAWCVVFFCRIWLRWIKLKTFNTTQFSEKNKSKYFITRPAYLSVELNAHNLLYLILLVQQKQLPPQSLYIHTFSSQACESIFRNTRALSGVYSTIVNFTVHDFLRRAQRLSLLNDIKCKHLNDTSVNNLVFPVHYKHRHDNQSLATQSQAEVDLIDVEQIITEAYHEAIDMLNGLEILNLLNDKNVLGLKPLSEYIFKQLNSNSKMYDYSSQLNQTDDGEFEIAVAAADDDNDDDNGTAADLNSNDGFSSNDDYDDDDEQDNTRNLINTTKEEFSGMKVFNMVQPHIEHSYFKATINDDIKYMHNQTACWLLTGEKSKMSTDRLLRVQQINKKS